MKYYVFFFITLTAVTAFFACAGMGGRTFQAGREYSARPPHTPGALVDGIYEGAARAYRGLIHVRLRVEEGVMAEIEIIDSAEDRFVGGVAINDLLEMALLYNSDYLDAISGATESSEGFLAALSDALEKARR